MIKTMALKWLKLVVNLQFCRKRLHLVKRFASSIRDGSFNLEGPLVKVSLNLLYAFALRQKSSEIRKSVDEET